MKSVYHEENPMLTQWRKRDALYALQDTTDESTVIQLCDQVLEGVGSDPFVPREATILITKYGTVGKSDLAQKVYEQGLEAGAQSEDEMRVKCALMNTYRQDGRFDEAKALFLELDSNMAYKLDAKAVRQCAAVAGELLDQELLDRAINAADADPSIDVPIELHVARIKIAAHASGVDAAQQVLDEVVTKQTETGRKFAPKQAVPLFEALANAYVAAGNHEGVLRTAEAMVGACQRPTERVVLQAIEATRQLGDNEPTNEQLEFVVQRFRAGPPIRVEVYEALMETLGEIGNHAGVCVVYREAMSKRRPTQRMGELLHAALRNQPRETADEIIEALNIQLKL